jgi:broad specificity phosphatase PhoE
MSDEAAKISQANSILDHTIQRWRKLHAWYKCQKEFPVHFILRLGEEPRYTTRPETDPQYDRQYCWWMCQPPSPSSKITSYGPLMIKSGFGNGFSPDDQPMQDKIKSFLLALEQKKSLPSEKESLPSKEDEIKKKKKVIFFIRHGESWHNADPVKFDQVRNPGLSDLGKKQASSLSGTSDLVILSPLKRAVETLAFSKIKSDKIVSSLLFREWTAHGASCWLEGENEKEIWETERDLQKRAMKAWQFVRTRPETFITIVAHGALNTAMLQCVGITKHFENCEIYRFDAPFA